MKLFIFIVILCCTLSVNFYLKPNSFDETESIAYSAQTPKDIKLFCMILTTEHSLSTKAKIVYETWASQCDGLKFISMIPVNLTSPNIIHKLHHKQIKYENMFDLLQPVELKKDTYKRLTRKVYAGFRYIYNAHKDYDWFLKVDDDSFIFIDNLRKFLSNKNKSLPVTYGYNLKSYQSGGAGYLLSQEALLRLGKRLNQNFNSCPNTGVEDRDMARCLRKLNVKQGKSIDSNGRERFHPYNMKTHYEGLFSQWLLDSAENSPQKVFDFFRNI